MPQAIVLPEPGSALELAAVADLKPKPGEILVTMAACGLNPVDYKLLAKGWPTWSYPHVTGVDGAGTVAALGDGVTNLAVGDRVAFHANMGGPGVFAEQACVDARAAFVIPESLSWEQAAGLPCAGLTAYLVCERKFPTAPANGVALVHAGAGGVGSFAIQLLKRQGLTVIATCSAHNNQFVTELGADHCIDYKNDNVAEQLRSLTNGRGADRIVSLVDRATATTDLANLAYAGHLACVVGLADLTELKPFTTSASIHEIALGAAHLAGSDHGIRDLAAMGRELSALVATGDITVPLNEVVPFQDIPEALNRLAQRNVPGKIVATIP